jgi:MinD superfamily P-loop ATPase
LKQIVILSGKGGTGKTSVAAAFAHLATDRESGRTTRGEPSRTSNEDQSPVVNPVEQRTVLVDADVDASNLELVLSPAVLETHEFTGGQVAIIDQELCEGCGVCAELCRFDAIDEQDGVYTVDPIACEGCALCFYQCPSGAISTEEQVAGEWFRSDSRYGPLFHAELWPAQENSGKLVTLVKQQGRLLAMDEGRDLVLVDGPPGIGCPVISAAAGADLALIVAEPTAAGIHDMARVLATTEHFGIPALVCINKADLYPEGAAEIEAYCQKKRLPVVGRLPFDTVVTKAMIQGQPVTAYSPISPVSQALRAAWERVLTAVDSLEVKS